MIKIGARCRLRESRGEHVVDVPVSMILPNGGVPDKTSGEKDFVGRLENSLEVRGEALGQRELFGDTVEAYPPGDVTLLTGDLPEPVSRRATVM